MRLFIAIELSEEIRNTLSQIQAHLKYAGADVKWVEKGNIHLTLKFLGEVTEEKVEPHGLTAMAWVKQIAAALDEIVKTTKPFEMSLKDIGAFPKTEYPRVIWVGLDKGAIESRELAERTDEALSRMGFEKEVRAFAAHLTIGRVRSTKNKDKLKEKIDSYQLLSLSRQLISSVILFQSTLTPKGPIYAKLHEAKFV